MGTEALTREAVILGAQSKDPVEPVCPFAAQVQPSDDRTHLWRDRTQPVAGERFLTWVVVHVCTTAKMQMLLIDEMSRR
jgi:hypothetical protein